MRQIVERLQHALASQVVSANTLIAKHPKNSLQPRPELEKGDLNFSDDCDDAGDDDYYNQSTWFHGTP